VPIIAMTANALKADLDACLAAGMNDHVTKPIDRQALLGTLRRWLPTRPAAPALEGIDVEATVQRLGIDRATLERMLVRFGDGQGALLAALRSAVAAGDDAGAARHAHAIAGAAGNLGADGLRAAAKALEQAGRAGGTDLSALLTAVEAHAATVFASIERLRPAAPAAATPPAAAFDRDTAGAALARLATALDGYDLSSATGALADLDSSGLPAWAADDLGRLHQHVDAYDYGEARGIAARLLGRVQRVEPS
jgi:two-component system sensor histidine kinase/response regulator